ncbi:MAG: hypothetical protein LBD16_00810, partial [Oscillospiraceae bacterium]|nr:hypothetical protein [Oscillospiraceae bacterium]
EYEISVAAETSKALFKFAVDNGLGFSNTIELRRQWLESIGINREFEAAYPSIADYAFYSTHRYPIIAVSSRKDEFYFKPVEGILETSQSVLEFLESTTCFEEILSYIAENAPNVSGAVMENYSEPIKAYFGRVSKHTRGDIKFRTIDLMYPSDYLHETIHVMLNTRIGTEILWSHEGIINWLLHKHNYPSDLRDRLNKMYSISESGLVSIGADLAQYIRLTNTIYDTKQNDLEEDNFNLFNYKEALLDASLILPISRELLPKMLTDTISDIYLTGLDRLLISPGMELSDVEAIHFIDYLIDKYSFETVLEFCLNQSPDYEAVFGLTYRELRADYLDYLTEETEGAGGMMD